ncbi:hypothetical protein BD410DRAFT_751028 [Rickenella mellea]|uniref:C2H2-type domain-containing protein n=1 Tax=Rickenella mellea TaxID=50990 RepID=A0A4Y7PYI9_9AGAM|nr:hypothetical protein BD410DRAFT_751028 [Rickenella mellea]
MARSTYCSPSPSLSARSPSPHFSESSPDELSLIDSSFDADASASRPASPTLSDHPGGNKQEPATVHCLWEDCGKPYSDLQALIEHIHNDHIGVNKSTYTCEWATCPRRGLQQASRFALISHIRAHTGEKPFTCPRPECDKSFTRSDAMAKHMRLQHNMSPPLPGRGGNRKRKRGDTGAISGHGYNTFKVEGGTPTEANGWENDEGTPMDERERGDYFSRRARSTSPGGGSPTSTPPDGHDSDDGLLPPHLAAALDPATGTIYGRPPIFAKYLVMKAKHRFLLEQHENLLEELRVVRADERKARNAKEAALDSVLRASLGPQAAFLSTEPDQFVPQSMTRADRLHPMGHGLDAHPY